MSYWTKTSTWGKIKDSVSGVLAIGQLSLVLNDSQHIYNVVCFVGQVAALLIPIWFEDTNRNGTADVFEKEVTVKVTSDTPIQTEVSVEKKENSAHSFSEGSDITS